MQKLVVYTGNARLTEVIGFAIGLKGFKYSQAKHQDLEVGLKDGDLTISGFWPCLMYLDARYPSPELLPGDPRQKAVLSNLAYSALFSPRPTCDWIEHYKNKQFICHNRPSILDVVAVVLAPQHPYVSTIADQLHDYAERAKAVYRSIQEDSI